MRSWKIAFLTPRCLTAVPGSAGGVVFFVRDFTAFAFAEPPVSIAGDKIIERISQGFRYNKEESKKVPGK